jgi:CopG family nickel-responsive transcriptional regulator
MNEIIQAPPAQPVSPPGEGGGAPFAQPAATGSPRRRGKVARFSVCLPEGLLEELDTMVERRGFRSRSQAIAALAHDGLVEFAGEVGEGAVAGTISLVYDYRKRDLQATLAEIQHRYYLLIVSSMHVHLEHRNYLEVLLVQGPACELRSLTNELASCKGVKSGRLSFTSAAIPPLK